MQEISLDAFELLAQYDPAHMLDRIHEVPQQCRQAWQMAAKFDLPRGYSQVNKVVILGMGGSAIGGDLVSGLAVSRAKLPIFTCRDYELPAFVDAQTLVIASSYSGMTEETLSSFERALQTDAKKLVITTGGRLESLAATGNIPVFRFDYPAQPRAALPFSLLPVLCFLQKLGVLNDMSADVSETVKILSELSARINEKVPLSRNPAKKLASQLWGHLPVIYGAGVVSEVAHRWKTQFNENSKTWAFYEVFPELNHNAIVGYQFPSEMAGKIMVVMLDAKALPARLRLRYRITSQLLTEVGVSYRIIESEGNSPLSQVMSLVLFGDYVSFYLSMLNKIDPTPVTNITRLKEQLEKSKP